MNKFLNSTMFKSVTGDVSMKRVIAFIYMMSGLVFVFFDMFTKFSVSYDLFIVVVGAGCTLMGVSIFEYFGKIKKADFTLTDNKHTQDGMQSEKEILID